MAGVPFILHVDVMSSGEVILISHAFKSGSAVTATKESQSLIEIKL